MDGIVDAWARYLADLLAARRADDGDAADGHVSHVPSHCRHAFPTVICYEPHARTHTRARLILPHVVVVVVVAAAAAAVNFVRSELTF